MPPMATSTSVNPNNEYDFMKYRAPTYNNGNQSNIPASNPNDYNLINSGSSYYPSYEDYPNFGAGMEQPSSWLHGADFNSTAGDLFTTSKQQNEPSFGNLSLNLDQIKIVRHKGLLKSHIFNLLAI